MKRDEDRAKWCVRRASNYILNFDIVFSSSREKKLSSFYIVPFIYFILHDFIFCYSKAIQYNTINITLDRSRISKKLTSSCFHSIHDFFVKYISDILSNINTYKYIQTIYKKKVFSVFETSYRQTRWLSPFNGNYVGNRMVNVPLAEKLMEPCNRAMNTITEEVERGKSPSSCN